MDQMLPSPGFPNIPSIGPIGTPLHQPEEDLILPAAQQAQHALGNSISNSQATSGIGSGLGGSGVISSYSSSGLGSSLTPHHLMAPQTPVSVINLIFLIPLFSLFSNNNKFDRNMRRDTSVHLFVESLVKTISCKQFYSLLFS